MVVGLGNIGRKRRNVLGSRCVATVDPYAAAADYVRLEECPTTAYDAVILAVPNQLKWGLIEYAVKQGKHVIVEKPLLLEHDGSAEYLDRLARQYGVRCYTAYNHRFEPLIMQLRTLLQGGAIGQLYYGRLHYGNGTVAQVVGSWREAGLGVLEDLGSHLLDLCAYLLPGEQPDHFAASALDAHEAGVYDHCVFVSVGNGPRLLLEATLMSWKNTFTVDLVGAEGSLHLSGLPKWGRSELVLRERVRPSGIPIEQRWVGPDADTTLIRELERFESLCESGPGTSAQNDLWITRMLREVGGGSVRAIDASLAGVA